MFSPWDLLAAGLGLAGLALLLAVWSWEGRRPIRQVGALLARSGLAHLGAVLVCTGLLFASTTWLARAAWAALGVYLVYHWAWRATPATSPPRLPRDPAPPPAALSPWRRGAAWLVRTELGWLALLFPFFLVPAPDRLWPVAGLPVLWLARRLATEHFVPPTPLDGALLVLLIMVLISLAATPDLVESLPKVTGVLFGVGLYYALVAWVTTAARVRVALGAYALAGLGLTGLGLIGTDWSAKIGSLGRLSTLLPPLLRGQFGPSEGFNSNQVGGSLLWVLPAQAAWLRHLWTTDGQQAPARRWAVRSGGLLILAGTSGTLLLTQSRTAWIALAVVGLGLGMVAVPRLRLPLGGVLVGGLLLGGLFLAQPDAGLADYGPAFSSTISQTRVQDRLDLWSRALYTIAQFPITGPGMNIFRRLMPMYYPMLGADPATDLGHAHNHLLQAALDLGLPGLVAYLAIWLIAGALAVTTWRQARTADTRWAVAGLAGGLAAFFLFGLTDTIALGAKPGVFFWALLGLLVAVWQVDTHELARL